MRVGIDLGTTNTVASYIDENGIWTPLEFRSNGSRENTYMLPSCIAFANGIIKVGQSALDQGADHPGDLLINTKYDMHTPEKKYNMGGFEITPVEAAGYILKEVRNELHRQFPREKSFNAFVTVPARFRNDARQATKKALASAGFETEDSCLTDEPIAAAIAYSSRLDGDSLVLVVDIGGGTYDLSLLKASIIGSTSSPDRLEPVAWEGDLHLGGNDVDLILLREINMKVVETFGKALFSNTGEHIMATLTNEEKKAASLLRAKVLDLKKQLYNINILNPTIYIQDLMDGRDFEFTITRDTYENLMRDLNIKMTSCINRIFIDSEYSSGDVDHVLVVGGMAHEMCLTASLYQIFGENSVIIPDDSMMLVSRGAAICNSNLKLHVENKAYSSIGILRNNRKDVMTIIKEGSIIDTKEMYEAQITLADETANAVEIEIIEYCGEFSVNSYTTIAREVIRLTDFQRGSGGVFNGFKKLFRGNTKTKFMLRIKLSEDKILNVYLVQQDGTESEISVRLGGK